jgi:hypothetical protein
MGQYYHPISLGKDNKPKGWVYSHDIKEVITRDDGQKFTCGSGLKLMEHSWLENKFVQTIENLLTEGQPWYKTPIVWAGDYADNEKDFDGNLYDLCSDDLKTTKAGKKLPKKFRYIVNHTKKEYVDKTKVPGGKGEWADWKIHPLPLLTAEGNNRGGGDYRGEDPNGLIGSWARNIISVETTPPEGYNELVFDLTE